MYRRVVRSLYFSTFKRITSIHRNTPCSYVQMMKYCQNTPQLPPEWKPAVDSDAELKLDFSSLDPDEFGTISNDPTVLNRMLEEMPEELEDKEQYVIRDAQNKKQRRPMKFYHHLIKNLLKEKKIIEAIDVLEVRMKQDNIRPDYYTYNLLVNGCARVGYCKKAFKLYSQMKKTGVKSTPATYTGLFNACAQSHDPEDGLIKLNNLRAKLEENRVPLTLINYHAMMKAYARLKDIPATFQVVDEILSKEFTLNVDTFCSLLQACISDKENGMRHALLTWHKMRQKKVRPNLTIYNLFIRCIRDCDFGGEDEVNAVIERILIDSKNSGLTLLDRKSTSDQEDKKFLESSDHSNSDSVSNVQSSNFSEKSELTFEEIEMVENRPNLLAKKPYLGNIISVGSVKTPADRLLLLGGFKNLLNEMEADKVKPDIKAFTQLLNILPSTESSENYLMKEMNKHKIDISIDFCNMLIKQRALRFDYEGAKNVLSILQSNYLQPDLITFGVMAMSCRRKAEAVELINNMRSFNMRLNAEILGAMVHQACCHFNFNYVIFLMKLTQKFKIRPTKLYMNHVETLHKRTVEVRRAMRKKKPVATSITKNPNFREESLIFSDYFSKWKKEVDIFESPHPYKQFTKPKENTPEKENEYDDSERFVKSDWKRSVEFTDGKSGERDIDDDSFDSNDEKIWHNTHVKSDRRAAEDFKKMEREEEKSTRTITFADEDEDDIIEDFKKMEAEEKKSLRTIKFAHKNDVDIGNDEKDCFQSG